MKLSAQIALCALLAGAAPAGGAETTISSASQPIPAPLRVVMFSSHTCPKCEQAERALAESARTWGQRIRIEKVYLDSNTEDGHTLLWAYDKHYQAQAVRAPLIFIGEGFLLDKHIALERLNALIAAELAAGSATYHPTAEDLAALTASEDRFDRVNFAAIVAAGLADGINPCAFTTIIFLLSMLAYLGKNKSQLLIVGIGFTAAVFVTYFLIGLLALQAVKGFFGQAGLPKILTWSIGILALVLAAWSLVDFVRYKFTGQAKDMTLGLPQSIRTRINMIIRERLGTGGLFFAAVTIGFLIAILESLCTGQFYLPAITLMIQSPGLRAHGLGYLLLYNLLFILPLIVILTIAYCGVTSDRLGQFFRRHLGPVKLLLAGMFAVMGILLLRTVW